MIQIRSAILAAVIAFTGCAAPAGVGQTLGATPEQPRSEQIKGRSTLRYVPAEPRALIFLFHGSGGRETFATNETTQRVLAPFVAAGYGFVASASAQRVEPQRWDLGSADPVSNPDIAYMLGLHRHLVAAGEIAATTPVFTMGMSNGGGMANLFGLAAKQAGLPVRAVADYMGPFPAPMRAATEEGARPPPTFVVAGERDGLVNASSVLAAAECLQGLGVKVETHVIKEAILTPRDFSKLTGIDEQGSATIFGDLVAHGILDQTGKRLFRADQPTITREDQVALADMLPAQSNRREIVRTLLTVWGGHMMRSDLAEAQFSFFEAALEE